MLERHKLINQQLTLEMEISKMQSALMVSRMRPHFLYNSLTVIQELCFTEPLKATEALDEHLNRTLYLFLDVLGMIRYNQ